MNLSPPSITTSFSRDSFDSLPPASPQEKENIATPNITQVTTSESSLLTKSSFREARKKLSPILMMEESSPFNTPINQAILPSKKLSALGVTSISQDTTEKEFLLTQGLSIKGTPKTGSFGKAYPVSKEDEALSLIYKTEKDPKTLTDISEPGRKFWRHGDFSSARLTLPHLVKTHFYITHVALPDGRKEDFLVPGNKTKEFAQLLPADATVAIKATIMEQAPGKNLEELEKEISFHPGEAHFHKVALAIHEFLLEAHRHNFIHRDLKPENIMYDPASEKITIIDTGEASRLRSREKNNAKMDQDRPSNPMTSNKRLGSRYFMSPRMVNRDNYGSELDFFSVGMLFLRLINKDDFEKFETRRSAGNPDDLLLEKAPQEFLPTYLQQLDPDNSTAQVFQKHPEVKEIIDLYFQASAGGSPEAATASLHALEQLKQLPYFQQR